ncbi:heme lyase CcmF/NrfE family subunit [Pantoea sp. UBA4549]|uniref:heme lyase CcmF/NrfE family subunit n=1 Tax=Pantoea sp. UBA4549 TaxID=1947033 RepID=UPI0025F44489|nr:heme lyase CcmF/NrfE family subunit [Pantoea sp. UBA4549]
MSVEIGHFALVLALALSIVQSIVPVVGAHRRDTQLMAVAVPTAITVFALICLASAVLVHAYVVSDFSVLNVVENSHSQKPLLYKITGVWGNHEGSMLLWVFILTFFSALVAAFSGNLPETLRANVLAVQGWIGVAFLAFIIFTSNPFTRIFPAPMEGGDLNPILQDIGLAIHPPLLYLGYVGFSVCFSFAVAALIEGRLDAAWARWVRPWALVAWMFLTGGIAMGSYWAYYELGWGGWWFWDPVENASFMPWLAGTALMHSLAVTEKRGSFKAWTVLLAIATFSLSLLGTFLVRSGVLVSVHAFASDPARGMFILAFLIIVIGSSLLLYALRGGQVRSRVQSEIWSRESFLLGNNVLLIAAMLVVLLGTLLPLVHKQLGLGSISVGEPFFNTLFSWLMAPFALLLGIGPLVRWRRDEPQKLWKRLSAGLVVTLLLSVLLPWLLEDRIEAMTVTGLLMAIWVTLLTLMELHERATHRHSLLKGLRHLSRSHWGMVLGHLGVAVTVVGIAFSTQYSVERDVRMKAGDSIDIHRYHFVFRDVHNLQGPNYSGGVAIIDVTRDGKPEAELRAEKRFYTAARTMMTEAAISGGFTRDLYAALGEELDNGAWAVRLYYKPFVRWIWFGGLFMAAGGLLCLLDPRYRARKKVAREERA